MSHDACFGIDGVQDLEQFVQYNHLLGSTVVLVLLLGAARVTALIADADALRVEALDVASSDVYDVRRHGRALLRGLRFSVT